MTSSLTGACAFSKVAHRVFPTPWKDLSQTAPLLLGRTETTRVRSAHRVTILLNSVSIKKDSTSYSEILNKLKSKEIG